MVKWRHLEHRIFNSNLKTCNATMLGQEYLPDLAICVNGAWYANGESLASVQEAKELIFSDSDSVYAKLDYVDRGSGITILREADFDGFVERVKGDYVIQKPVSQHPSLSRYYAAAVSTLRVLTFVAQGDRPRMLAAYLRLGRGGARFVSADGNAIKLPVSDETGGIHSVGIDDEWVTYSSHPDTGIGFEDYKIPAFMQCVSICEDLHRRIPHLALIGWDIAIDGNSNAWVLEWNAVTPAFKYIEAMAGPLFQDLDVALLM